MAGSGAGCSGGGLSWIRADRPRAPAGSIARFCMPEASLAASLIVGFLLRFQRVSRHFPDSVAELGNGSVRHLGIAYSCVGWRGSRCWPSLLAASHRSHGCRHTAPRGGVSCRAHTRRCSPRHAAVLGYGVFIERHQHVLREHRPSQFPVCRTIWTGCAWCS